jgi:hypothetical protein
MGNPCGPTVRGEFPDVKMQILEDGVSNKTKIEEKDRHAGCEVCLL